MVLGPTGGTPRGQPVLSLGTLSPVSEMTGESPRAAVSVGGALRKRQGAGSLAGRFVTSQLELCDPGCLTDH